MTAREAELLLGGYAAGILTERERTALFSAALENQQLFDALADEEALRSLLADPRARAALLRALETVPAVAAAAVGDCSDGTRKRWWQSWLQPAPVAAATAIALAAIGIVLLVPTSHESGVDTALVIQPEPGREVSKSQDAAAPPRRDASRRAAPPPAPGPPPPAEIARAKAVKNRNEEPPLAAAAESKPQLERKETDSSLVGSGSPPPAQAPARPAVAPSAPPAAATPPPEGEVRARRSSDTLADQQSPPRASQAEAGRREQSKLGTVSAMRSGASPRQTVGPLDYFIERNGVSVNSTRFTSSDRVRIGVTPPASGTLSAAVDGRSVISTSVQAGRQYFIPPRGAISPAPGTRRIHWTLESPAGNVITRSLELEFE